MNAINWLQVLEIETYLIKVLESNIDFLSFGLMQDGTKSNIVLDKNKSYEPYDITEYLIKKYPNNEFFKKAHEGIAQLSEFIINGGKLTEVDKALYQLNNNSESLQVSELEQRKKFIETFNNSNGIDIFWYNLLKSLFDKNSKSEFSIENVLSSYIGLCDNFLNANRKISIKDFDNSIFPNKPLGKWNSGTIDFLNKYELVEQRILKFKESRDYRLFLKMCDSNDYTCYYSDKDPEEFLKDSIAFSLNLICQRIKNSTSSIFGFDLRKTHSLYPEDIINSPLRTLQVYISPYGFYSFNKVKELFNKGLFEAELKIFLSNDFEIIEKSAIVDNEASISQGNMYNSSLIVGKKLKYENFRGKRTKQNVKKLISGTFWFNDDVNGTNLDYLCLHPKSAHKGEYERSIPAINVLFYYSELRLEKADWERDLEDIENAGYQT